jgi:diguanylate cyclase (GGDEF)-like protein
MSSRESPLFTATALPAGMVSIGLTAALAAAHHATLGARLPAVAGTTLLALASYRLSFATNGRARASLELGYLIAAALALPFPAAMIAGVVSAAGGTALRSDRSAGGFRRITLSAANCAIAASTTGAASLLAYSLNLAFPERAGLPAARLFLFAGLLFTAMNAVTLFIMTAWITARGESPGPFARRLVARILPVEAVTIPFAALLAGALGADDRLMTFALVGAVGLFASLLLKRLSDSEDRLRRANHDLEERLGELATLNAIGREISSTLDASRVFEIVRRECRKVFRPDFLWIARVDMESREVSVDYAMAGNAPPRRTRFPLGQGLTTHVIETQRPLLVRDAGRELPALGLKPILLEPKIRSILAVPLLVENRAVGVLSVQSFHEGAYAERHVSLLTTIAQQAAVALENARHYQLATIDRLTGLYQRDYFFQRLEDEHRRASRYGTAFSVLMLDLDSFKRINDRFGHFAGDRFLRAAGAAIRGILRAADIPCRYGGEEFCVLLPETDGRGARAIAERIRMAIASLHVEEGGGSLGTTVSIGVSCYPDHYEGSLAGLLQKADQALYAAKRAGKDRVMLSAA